MNIATIKTEVRPDWFIFGFVSNPDYFEGRYVEYMKIIDIHLTDEQYEKLQILQNHAGYDKLEEAGEEFFSTALLAAWDNYKSKIDASDFNAIRDTVSKDGEL